MWGNPEEVVDGLGSGDELSWVKVGVYGAPRPHPNGKHDQGHNWHSFIDSRVTD